MKKIGKKMLVGILVLIVAVILGVFAYMQHPKFGKAPSGETLERIQKSGNFKNGAFQNLSETPQLAEGFTMYGVLWDFLFTKYPETQPLDSIPSVKVNFKDLNPNENVLIWFGHSSYFIQLHGKKYLIDPVLSGNASPVPGTTRAFNCCDIVTVNDLPSIDYLLITHDHYDHLDYETIQSIEPKIKQVICGLGVGSHLEYWGYNPEIIEELDWNQSTQLNENTILKSYPARHFSGRNFKRNTTLWTSFALNSNGFKIYIGGDSGYDFHFKKIGEEFGPFDLAILENGQYNEKWKYIHMLPEETVQSAVDLNAKRFIPVHNSKFKLATHKWFEPLEKVTEIADKRNLKYITPKIGEIVNLDDSTQNFSKWWKGLK